MASQTTRSKLVSFVVKNYVFCHLHCVVLNFCFANHTFQAWKRWLAKQHKVWKNPHAYNRVRPNGRGSGVLGTSTGSPRTIAYGRWRSGAGGPQKPTLYAGPPRCALLLFNTPTGRFRVQSYAGIFVKGVSFPNAIPVGNLYSGGSQQQGPQGPTG